MSGAFSSGARAVSPAPGGPTGCRAPRERPAQRAAVQVRQPGVLGEDLRGAGPGPDQGSRPAEDAGLADAG